MAGLLFKLKQTVGLSERTMDPQFEEARKAMMAINARSEIVCKTMEKQQAAIAEFIANLRTMCDAGVAPGAERVSAAVSAPTARSVERIKIVSAELKAWHVRVHAAKSKISERDSALQEVDRYADVVSSIPPVGATPEQATKRQVTETKLGASKHTYETINTWLLAEIQSLEDMNRTEIEPKIGEIFALYSSLFSSLAQAFAPYGGAAQQQATATISSSFNSAPQYQQPQPQYPPQQQQYVPQPQYPPQQQYIPQQSQSPQGYSLPQKPVKPLPVAGDGGAAAPPPLPPKAHRAPPPLPPSQSPPRDFEGQVGHAAGQAVASAAMNPQVQMAVGNAAASAATNEETQRRIGESIAERTENPFLRSLASNSAVQKSMGNAIGSAATNRAVQQKTANFVATQAQDENNQRRMASGIKTGFSAAVSTAKQQF